MKGYYLRCDWDFKGANLCSNSGVYLSPEKAIEVFNSGVDFDHLENVLGRIHYSFESFEKADMAQLTEIEIE